MTDTWLTSMNNRQITGAVFIDPKKAFDLVDHHILLTKLKLYLGFSPSPRRDDPSSLHITSDSPTPVHDAHNVLSFFQSYFCQRQQYVQVNGSSSRMGLITRGVPQGSVLGPLLFCLFINDLPLHLTSNHISCDLFADDATIHTPDKDISVVQDRLQQEMDEITDWCSKNSMLLNPSKTECMIIATRQKHQLAPLNLNLSIQNDPVTQVAEHRLLGVTIDNQLRWQAHINKVCKSVSRNLYLLSKLKQYVGSDARMLFYNAHVRSHIDYASTIWDGSSEVHLKRLNALNRRAAKYILPDQTLSTDEKLQKLKILPLSKRLLFNKGVTMFKAWNKHLPRYLCQFFSQPASQYSTSRLNFTVPKPRIDIFKSSLSFSGAHLWNKLPIHVKRSGTLSLFKKQLFKHLMSSNQ